MTDAPVPVQESGEGIPPKYRTFWRRFWASPIDGVLFWPLGWINDALFVHDVEPVARVVWMFFYALFPLAYSVWMHARFGQTLGKMITRVKVLSISETTLSFSQALLRDSVPILLEITGCLVSISLVLRGWSPLNQFSNPLTWSLGQKLHMLAGGGWFFAECVTMLMNDKRRAIHDFIAGSVVVRTRVPVRENPEPVSLT